METVMVPGSDPQADVEFRAVSKRFGQVVAASDLNFTVRKGSFHAFLGASGCGKTTTLRMVAGFEQPTSGDILLAGQSVTGVPAYCRSVNMVFQHYALFPHLNVSQNVAYGLRYARPKPDSREQAKRVAEALDMVRLGEYGSRRVWELSGGQQQRVALARALVNQPKVLLLDEPLAALDRKLRKEMQTELLRLQREVGITFIMVTHDQEEALSMSDQISIMHAGRIIQTASPVSLYESPANRYVADFVGESNFFQGETRSVSNGELELQTARGITLRSPLTPASAYSAENRYCIAVRPEAMSILPYQAQASGLDVTVPGQIEDRIYLGDNTEYRVKTDELGNVSIRVPKHRMAEAAAFQRGDKVTVGWRQHMGLALAEESVAA